MANQHATIFLALFFCTVQSSNDKCTWPRSIAWCFTCTRHFPTWILSTKCSFNTSPFAKNVEFNLEISYAKMLRFSFVSQLLTAILVRSVFKIKTFYMNNTRFSAVGAKPINRSIAFCTFILFRRRLHNAQTYYSTTTHTCGIVQVGGNGPGLTAACRHVSRGRWVSNVCATTTQRSGDAKRLKFVIVIDVSDIRWTKRFSFRVGEHTMVIISSTQAVHTHVSAMVISAL